MSENVGGPPAAPRARTILVLFSPTLPPAGRRAPAARVARWGEKGISATEIILLVCLRDGGDGSRRPRRREGGRGAAGGTDRRAHRPGARALRRRRLSRERAPPPNQHGGPRPHQPNEDSLLRRAPAREHAGAGPGARPPGPARRGDLLRLPR